MRSALLLFFALLLCLPPDVAADATGETGTIEGHVRVVHAPDLAPPRPIARQQQVCGRQSIDESAIVGADGALANVVASVGGLRRPAGWSPATVRLDQQRCRFAPHVLTATRGATLEVTSQDSVLHTAHAVLGQRRTLFNVAIPVAGLTVRKPLNVAGRIRFFCDVGHTWMSAFLLVFHHPYHAVSAEDGTVRIENVPVGERTVYLWHERLGERTARVTVAAGATTSFSTDF